MPPDERRKMAMRPHDDPYRSIRRHMGAAVILLLLVFLAASAAWLTLSGM
jgi:hypothetical protein